MFLFVFDDHREMELIKKFNLFLSQWPSSTTSDRRTVENPWPLSHYPAWRSPLSGSTVTTSSTFTDFPWFDGHPPSTTVTGRRRRSLVVDNSHWLRKNSTFFKFFFHFHWTTHIHTHSLTHILTHRHWHIPYTLTYKYIFSHQQPWILSSLTLLGSQVRVHLELFLGVSFELWFLTTIGQNLGSWGVSGTHWWTQQKKSWTSWDPGPKSCELRHVALVAQQTAVTWHLVWREAHAYMDSCSLSLSVVVNKQNYSHNSNIYLIDDQAQHQVIGHQVNHLKSAGKLSNPEWVSDNNQWFKYLPWFLKSVCSL